MKTNGQSLLITGMIVLLSVATLSTHAKSSVIFTNLYSFTGGNDGAGPEAGLIQSSDGNLYGTTYRGGTNGIGTVFKISTDGALTSLYSFTGGYDGANPWAAQLVQGSDGNLYGTTDHGGTNNFGTVFRISTNGVLTPLYSFTGGNDGANPYAGLVQGRDGNFYGTSHSGGTNNFGTVFTISTNGTFTPLYSFTGGLDGAKPYAALVQGSDGNFYGTTFQSGTNNAGTVFTISTNGALTTLHDFTSYTDGATPYAGLVQGSDGNFYGTTYAGGSYGFGYFGYGTMFKMSSGTLTNLYSFSGGKDGGDVQGGLVQGSDGNFYGTTALGGTNNCGTVFQISSTGSLNSLHSFAGGNEGQDPSAGLLKGSDGNFYGTTFAGGIYTNQYGYGNGTIFRLTVVPESPQLSIKAVGANVILTWPISEGSFNLECATNLAPPLIWNTTLAVPVSVNGQNIVTNPISNSQMFFRLSQ